MVFMETECVLTAGVARFLDGVAVVTLGVEVHGRTSAKPSLIVVTVAKAFVEMESVMIQANFVTMRKSVNLQILLYLLQGLLQLQQQVPQRS